MKIRLNRYLSMCGASSRRKADELISEGKVMINGSTEKDMGLTVDTEKDVVLLEGRIVKPEEKRYLVLYKPRLYVTAIGQGQDDKKTLDELIKDIPTRVYPVGRLDYDVEGLLILTNDGELANRVMHPKYELSKLYWAMVKGNITPETLSEMKKGIMLGDGRALPDSIKIIKKDKDTTTVLISFHEGRNHLVKRFFTEYEHNIIRLKRVSVGPLEIGALKPGQWRDINEVELKKLFSVLYPGN